MKHLGQRLTFFLALGLLLLSACTMPRNAKPTTSGSGLIYTVAAQTVQAQLTEVSRPGTPFALATFTPPVSFPSATPLPPTAVLLTSAPPGASVPCDRAQFVKDVNFPDNTKVNAGESFVKTWRLKNDGSCTWTASYAVVYTNGDAMGAPTAIPLTGSVAPGETIDISISLKAPEDGGTFRANFKLRNSNNVVFGVTNENKPFWVQIKVTAVSGLLYDFLVQADAATWFSGSGTEPGTTLPFEGAADNANGAVKIMDQVRLETGLTSGKVLLTFPRHDATGFITGLFPVYKVQSGDHFKARLGFMIPTGNTCGSGEVVFQLYYKEGDGDPVLLKEWSKSCNKNLMPVDVSLSALKGKEVQFAFTVRADGDATDDWAIWNSPRIEH
jgi:hypothetical protein